MIRYVKDIKRPKYLAGCVGTIRDDLPKFDERRLLREGYAVEHVAAPVPAPVVEIQKPVHQPIIIVPRFEDDIDFGEDSHG